MVVLMWSYFDFVDFLKEELARLSNIYVPGEEKRVSSLIWLHLEFLSAMASPAMSEAHMSSLTHSLYHYQWFNFRYTFPLDV